MGKYHYTIPQDDSFGKFMAAVMFLALLALLVEIPILAYKEGNAWYKWSTACDAANGLILHEAYGGSILCESPDRKILGVW